MNKMEEGVWMDLKKLGFKRSYFVYICQNIKNEDYNGWSFDTESSLFKWIIVTRKSDEITYEKMEK